MLMNSYDRHNLEGELNMQKPQLPGSLTGVAKMVLALVLVAAGALSALAQHGHPLQGSWSGDWQGSGGQTARLLILIDFNADQVISGNIIEGGVRVPITTGVLDPEGWKVQLGGSGADRAGNQLALSIEGSIENIGSPTQRAIVGTMNRNGVTGSFRAVIN